ncbi:MAG: hypothetical protein IKT56_01020 [Clostridia bacterium]|nr:hypothetical protein [Clostridia bacterium]
MKNRKTETFTLRYGINGDHPVELHIPVCLYPSFEAHIRCEKGKNLLATFFEKYETLSVAERSTFQFFLLENYTHMIGISDLLPMLNAMCKVMEREKKATE